MSTYEISKSSLLSLKAEILKKQEEVNKAKLENKNRIPKEIKKGPLELKNKGVEERSNNDITEEEQDLLKKSRSILEAKSKLYDKLSKGTKNDEEKEFNRRKYLVHFDKKAHSQNKNSIPPPEDEDDYDKYPESEEEKANEDDYKAQNSDDEWVEYVDCLGRTRTCLKKDLASFKKKDSNLRSNSTRSEKSVSDDEAYEKEEEQKEENEFNESSEMLSGDMRRELQRQQWEREEAELQDKKNVHYQDILFKEARTHGVGYYGFSKDEEERAKQQDALKKLREETKEQQKQAQEIKKNREKQLAARIRAAKNRKRARMGLPALTSDDEVEEESKVPEEVNEEANEEPNETDKEREAIRKMHVRPWDVGKDGVKEHYEYSQEEWVQLQRKKRDKDFAPPRAYNSISSFKVSETDDNKGLYFSSSKKNKSKDEFYVNINKPPPDIKNPCKKKLSPKKIVNECSDDEDDRLMQDFQQVQKDSETAGRKRAEIPPPATFDYYGPSGSKKSKTTPIDMEDSIMEGLKYLRQKIEKKHT